MDRCKVSIVFLAPLSSTYPCVEWLSLSVCFNKKSCLYSACLCILGWLWCSCLQEEEEEEEDDDDDDDDEDDDDDGIAYLSHR